MTFSSDIAGTCDAVWDRASLVAIRREDVSLYINVIKDILKPGGRCLLEVMDYDVNIMNDVTGTTKPPPPFPMYEPELKQLYEPHFTVEYLDRAERTLQGKIFIYKCFYSQKSVN